MITSAFAHHPGGMQHPGMAHGQPMAPGQVPHPGQPMGQPMMHPGVSGPAGPHVSQSGQMVGLQPGLVVPGGPSAQAMAHLAPNGQMIQPQNIPNNPMMQQHHQQMQQHQMQQAMFRHRMQLHMQQNNAVGMNPMGATLTPQQIAAMRGAGAPVNLAPHMQSFAGTPAAMQLHAAQQAAAQAQHQHQNIASQHHHLNMQHATSQGSNQGHPTPQSQPGGPQSGPPNRPPTSMGGPHSAHPSPAQAQEPQPGQQPGPQPGPQQSQPPQQPSTSAPQMQPSQAQAGPLQAQQGGPQGPQPAQQAPQPGQQVQGQQGPQQQVQPGQSQQAHAQQQAQTLKNQAQTAQAQNAAAARQFMQQRHAAQQGMAGGTLLKIFNFADKLGAFRISDGNYNDISFWKKFINNHFTDDGTLRMILRPMASGEKAAAKTFEVGAPSLPRYFWTQYDSRVDQIQILLDGVRESNLADNYHSVIAHRSRMIYWFKDGTELVWNGALTALYLGDRMENLTFDTKEHQQFIPRSRLEELCAQASPDQNKSPRMTKKANPRAQQRQQAAQPSFDRRMLPSSPVNEMGVTPRIQNFLEISETFSFMKDLMDFAQEHPKLSVSEAMNALVQTFKANQQQNMASQMSTAQQQFLQQQQHQQHQQQQQQHQQQQQASMNMPHGAPNNPAIHHMQQQGARTPNAPGMQGQFMSPAMQNSLLPGANQANGSPHTGNPMLNPSLQGNTHTPSPAQSHMAAPMVPQQSQQGSTSGASTSASPNTNKRRRSTQIGIKDEDSGGQPNGQPGASKVKQSPRMNPNAAKRLKGS